MSLFTDNVDRYFVGKLAVGLLFVFSFLEALLAAIVLTGVAPHPSPSPENALIQYGVASLLWFVAFRFIESRRRRAAA
jgi:hypothetical protein